MDAGLAEEAVGAVQGDLAEQAVHGVLDELLAQRGGLHLQEGLCRSCGLNMRSWTRKYSQTGPVTVNPVPSARPSMFTTSEMTEATTWMSYAVMSGPRRSP